jgi:hypothetical protein
VIQGHIMQRRTIGGATQRLAVVITKLSADHLACIVVPCISALFGPNAVVVEEHHPDSFVWFPVSVP